MGLIRFIQKAVRFRWILIFLAHLCLYAAAYFLSFLLRFDFRISAYLHSPAFWIGAVMVLLLRTVGGAYFGLYKRVLKYAGMPDLLDIVRSMTMASVAFIVGAVLLGLREIPRSIFVLEWVASIVLVGGLRLTLRMMREMVENSLSTDSQSEKKRVLIIGAGDAGESLLRELERLHRDRYHIVGFLDDDPKKKGLSIRDVKVLGPVMYLGDMVSRFRVDQVLIAIPTLKGEDMRRIVSICKIAGVQPKTLPSVAQFIEGQATVSQLRDVAIDDLLGRDPVELEDHSVRAFLRDRCVMVTGAGGSIGSELCRQILRFAPRSLLLVERAEPNLFFIHRELSESHPDAKVVPLIADITDGPRMRRIFEEHAPEVIFHAAAHKHVPMMEWNPAEAIKNNSFGTRALADLAHEFRAHAFVMISTDKAVNPTSVMGASKRIAEMYVQALAQESQTKFTAVRFGNVLGSVGSVIPIFKDQIAKGGPITVTHPDMTRYFMTIPESCQLVMQAGSMGRGGEIFALDMGQPVKIVDLALDLITLSGLEPGKDIQIIYTGLRPGEKLFEELGFDAERMAKTRHPKIYIGKLAGITLDEISQKYHQISHVLEDSDPAPVRAAIKWMVPEFLQNTIAFSPSAHPTPQSMDEFPVSSSTRSSGDGGGARITLADITSSGERPPDLGHQENLPPPSSPPTKAPDDLTEWAPDDSVSKTAQPARAYATTSGVSLTKGWFAPADIVAPELDWDSLWANFVSLCKEKGFVGAGWQTRGIQPVDQRKTFFSSCTEDSPQGKEIFKRPLPISTYSFLELMFIVEAGKESAMEELRAAAREIRGELGSQIRQRN